MSGFERPPSSRPTPIPLTVLTGATGSGKTRLLNRLLQDKALAHTGVILNEQGATVLAHGLVQEAEDGIVELGSGCVCCTSRGAFTEALEQLLRALDNKRIPALSRVVVETAGEADPLSLIASVALHPYLVLRYAVDGIVTVVGTGNDALDGQGAAAWQVATADRLVLSHPDEASHSLRERLAVLNPDAPIRDADDVAPLDLFGPRPAPANAPPGPVRRFLALPEPGRERRSRNADGVTHFSLAADEALPRQRLDLLVDLLGTMIGADLMRVSGVVNVEGEASPLLVQGADGVFLPLIPVEAAAETQTRLAFIGAPDAEARVRSLWESALGRIRPDAADIATLADNPLSIPGFSRR